ncbi:hypothetical protein BDAP_000232 [Binucleata daphniae]
MSLKHKNRSMILATLNIFTNSNLTGYFIVSIIFISIIVIKKTEIEIQILQDTLAQQKTQSKLLSFTVKILVFEIFGNLLQNFKSFAFANVFGKQIEIVSVKAFRNILNCDNLDMLDKENGITQNNIRIGSNGMASLLSTLVLNILPQGIGVVFLMQKFASEFSSMFSVFVFIAFVICALLHFYMIMLKIRYQKIMVEYEGKGQKTLYEALNNIEMIKSYGTEEVEEKKYYRNIKKGQHGIVYYKKITYILTFLHLSLFSLLKSIVFYYYITKSVDVSLPRKLSILKSLLRLSELNATRTGTIYLKLKKNIQNATCIRKYMGKDKKNSLYIHLDKFYDSIVCRNVDIKYDDVCCINNINVKIQKGDKIAIVGANGIGKSSFLKLLMKLIEYDGEVEIDNHNIADLHDKSYRQIFAYVPQNITLFDNTILYNLTYGTKSYEQEQLYDICDMLDLTDSIKQHSKGFATEVDENGFKLSGGMRQKILICRALLRNAQVLLLDEATSNLDYKTTKKFIDYITKKTDTTVVIVTHQKDVISKFDKFLYFNNGSVEMFEDHTSMIKKCEI